MTRRQTAIETLAQWDYEHRQGIAVRKGTWSSLPARVKGWYVSMAAKSIEVYERALRG